MATHRISYAYPSSPMARKLGHYAQGCHVVQIGAALTAHASYTAALAYVAPMGTSPERWSVDHPENARFAPASERAREVAMWRACQLSGMSS